MERAMQIRTPVDLGLSFRIDAGDRLPGSSDDITPIDIDAVVSTAKGGRK